MPSSPTEPTFDAREEREIPGDAIDGYRLALGIRYAAKVTPKEDGLIVFTSQGPNPLVSGHDQRRAHTAYFSAKSAFHFEGVVPRDEALAFADMLDGLSWPRVRLGLDGTAIIRHGTAQPAARFDLGTRSITQRWRPPTQQNHPTPAVGPLRIHAGWQAQACRWGKAVAHVYQSASGIEWVTLSDIETGELLARAVLAEDGHDLYPEDDRQTEIPGSRTAGRLAPVTLHAPTSRTNTEKMLDAAAATGASAVGAVTIEVDGQAMVISSDLAARDGSTGAGFPTPGARPVVIEIPASIFDELTHAEASALRFPSKQEVFWFVGTEAVTSGSMDAESARAASLLLVAMGLTAKSTATTRNALEVDLWAVERVSNAKAGG